MSESSEALAEGPAAKARKRAERGEGRTPAARARREVALVAVRGWVLLAALLVAVWLIVNALLPVS
jgi:hypothetical protein